MQLLNISCKGGSLRVTPDGFLVHTSMAGKPVWQISARGVSVVEVSRKIMATIEVRTPQGSRLVEWVSPGDIVKLQQALAQVQAMPSYSQNPYAANAPTYQSQPQYPQYPHQQPGRFGQPPTRPYTQPQQKPTAWQWYRAQRSKTRRGIGCGVIVAILLLIGMCSSVVSAASNSGNQANSDATPTNQVVQQAASSTDTPTTAATATATPTPKPKPTPRPTTPPAQPTPTSAPSHTGVNGNPWGYDFNSTGGSMIYNPPATFCSYFACITTFWNGHGYVDQCVDGDYSKSGGLSGACSHHGGEQQPLYSH